MRRALFFFFTFVFAMGCGSDPTIGSEPNQEAQQQPPSEPSIETGIRPPTVVGQDDVARIDDSRGGGGVDGDEAIAIDAEQKLAARRFSNRAVLESPYRLQCSFLPICLEAAYRRPERTP